MTKTHEIQVTVAGQDLLKEFPTFTLVVDVVVFEVEQSVWQELVRSVTFGSGMSQREDLLQVGWLVEFGLNTKQLLHFWA